MEVKNVLEQLYNGEIFPAEQYAPKGEEYRKIHQGHYHHYEDFIEVLAKLEPPLDTWILGVNMTRLVPSLREPHIFLPAY